MLDKLRLSIQEKLTQTLKVAFDLAVLDLVLAKLTAVVCLMQIKARVLLHDTVSGLQFSFYSIDIKHSACVLVMNQKFAMSSLDLFCFESHAFQ